MTLWLSMLQICLFVFDLSNRVSMERVESWFADFKKVRPTMNWSSVAQHLYPCYMNWQTVNPNKCEIVLLGNKCDLGGIVSGGSSVCGSVCGLHGLYGQSIDPQEGRALAKKLGYGCTYIETSAKTGKNIEEAIMGPVRRVIEAKSKIKPTKSLLDEFDSPESTCCCLPSRKKKNTSDTPLLG